MEWKIVVDSGCDLHSIENLPVNVAFESIPLKINIGEKEYADDASCNIEALMNDMSAYKGHSATSCPSPEAWAAAFREADHCIAIASSSGVSGSLNSARLGREMTLEKMPEKHICIIDSLSIGPEMTLIAEEALRLIEMKTSFEEICTRLNHYTRKAHLCFMLNSVDNLVKNGRLSRLAAATVNVLGIRLVGIASDKGTLKLENKSRGLKRAIKDILAILRTGGYNGGKIRICHVFNDSEAKTIANAILKEFPNCTPRFMKCGALCSFYAEMGGILIGFEGDAL